MRRAFMVILNALERSFLLDPVQHGLEFADIDHIAEDTNQGWLPVLFPLALRLRDVSVERNLLALEHGARPYFYSIHHNSFRHDFCPLIPARCAHLAPHDD